MELKLKLTYKCSVLRQQKFETNTTLLEGPCFSYTSKTLHSMVKHLDILKFISYTNIPLSIITFKVLNSLL